MNRIVSIAAAVAVAAFAISQSGCIYSRYKAHVTSLDPGNWGSKELSQKEDFVEVKDGKLVLRRVKVTRGRSIIYPPDFAFFWKGGNDGAWLEELVCRFPTMWLELPFAYLNYRETTSDFEIPVPWQSPGDERIPLVDIYSLENGKEMKTYGRVDCGSTVVQAEECGGLAPCGDSDAVEVRLKLSCPDVRMGKCELYAEVNCKDGPKEVLLDKIPYGLMFLKGRNAYIIRPRMEYSRDWYFGIPCNECRGAVLRRIDVLTGEMSTVACLKCDNPICE